MACEKCQDEPTNLRFSSQCNAPDEGKVKKSEGKPQEIVAAPAHPALLNGQHDLIENVQRNEQQAEPRNRKQVALVRRQQNAKQEISNDKVNEPCCKADNGSCRGPIAFALGI